MGHKTGFKYTIYTHLKTSQISQNSLPLFLEYHLKGTIFYTLNIPVSNYVIEGNLRVKLESLSRNNTQIREKIEKSGDTVFSDVLQFWRVEK